MYTLKFNYRDLRTIGRALAMYYRTHQDVYAEDCYNIIMKLVRVKLTEEDENTIVEQFERYPK